MLLKSAGLPAQIPTNANWRQGSIATACIREGHSSMPKRVSVHLHLSRLFSGAIRCLLAQADARYDGTTRVLARAGQEASGHANRHLGLHWSNQR